MEDVKAKIGEIKSYARLRAKNQVPYIVLMLCSIAMTGLMELVVVGFSLETLKNADFWFNLIMTNTSAFLMAFSSTLMNSDNIRLDINNGLGKQANQLYDVVVQASANVRNDIDIFIYLENLKRKENAYRVKINRKILKLEKHFKEKDTNCYAEYKLNKETKLTKRVKQRIKLDHLVSDEYIKEHIKYLKVKYAKITRKMIENGSMNNGDDGTLAKKGKVLMSGILPKFILSMSLTICLSSFMPDYKKGITIAILVSIVYKLIILLFNYIYGRDFAPDYFTQTTLNDLQVRREWLTKYNEWCSANKVDNNVN